LITATIIIERILFKQKYMNFSTNGLTIVDWRDILYEVTAVN